MTRQRLTWVLAIGAVAAAVFFNGHSGQVAKTESICTAINKQNATLRSYIDNQISRAQKSLPTIEYYKHHPVELGKQLVDLQNQREDTQKAFADVSC